VDIEKQHSGGQQSLVYEQCSAAQEPHRLPVRSSSGNDAAFKP
jgi:hypothetical protein